MSEIQKQLTATHLELNKLQNMLSERGAYIYGLENIKDKLCIEIVGWDGSEDE